MQNKSKVLKHLESQIKRFSSNFSFIDWQKNNKSAYTNFTDLFGAPERDALVFHFPHYDMDLAGPASAIMLGDYKLIKFYETNKLHLFDLSKDIGEENDLAGRKPEVVAKLHDRLNEYLASVDAQMPRPNPNYDPSSPVGGRRERNNRRRRTQ